MRNKALTLTLLFFIGLMTNVLPAMAQYAKGVKISLPTSTTIDGSPDRLFYIDSVYATFPDTATIGTVYRAMLGEIVPAYLKNGVSKNVEQCLFSHYPMLKPAHRPVRLRIDQLTYTEDPAQGYELEAELTFLQQDSAQHYVPFYTASIETGMGGFGRGGNIAEQLLRGIGQMNAYLNAPTRLPNYFNDHETAMRKAAVDMKLDTARYTAESTAQDNLLTCQQKRAGIYLNEQDLIRNRPALTGSLTTESRKERVSLLRPDKRRSRYRFLGFCSNGEIYINTNRYGGNRALYARVLDVGPYLIWRDNYVTVSERSMQAAAVGAGGMLGGLIAAAATNYRDCIAIDTKTGNMLNVTPEVLKTILVASPALLAEYQTTDAPNKSGTIFDFMVRYNQAMRK